MERLELIKTKPRNEITVIFVGRNVWLIFKNNIKGGGQTIHEMFILVKNVELLLSLSIKKEEMGVFIVKVVMMMRN